jgi:FMN phosphatase YigB (HAD superfamily)
MLKHLWFDFAGTLYKETPEFSAAHDSFRFQVYADLQHINDPEVAATLLKLKEIMSLSLFTNFMPHRIDMLLEHLSIPKDCFTHILSGDDIPERKPALDGFYKMIELSGVPAREIMYVGDRVDVDIKPAKQVGMQTCLIYSDSGEADSCIDHFSDIEDVVKSV